MSLQRLRETQESHHLILAARVSAATAALIEEGEHVSFYAVAKRAEIARSTLYRCDDLRQLVVTARDVASSRQGFGSSAQGATADDLDKQLRQVTLERDLLLSALNEQGESSSGRSFRYASVSLGTAA